MSTNKSQAIDSSYVRQDSYKGIVKSSLILSLGTLASRILGFLRDVLLAKVLGTGFGADVFFAAFKIPNLFRDFIGEGAVNSSMVPVFSEYHEKDKKTFFNFINIVFSWALISLTLLTLIGIFLAPFIVRITVPGFMSDPDKLSLTISLTKLMFPYLILVGLAAYCMGVSYTYRSFLAPAIAQCFLNGTMIVAAILSLNGLIEPVFGLAMAVIFGGIFQLIVQFSAIHKKGFRIRIPKTLYHPGAVKIGRLLVPRMIGGGVYQLTVLADTFCASLAGIVGAGGISAIYYANRIIQFPVGVFGVSLAVVVLPALSGHAFKNDINNLKKTLTFSLENIFFIMTPITIIFMVLCYDIIRILFQRGQFNEYSTFITSSALFFYSIGLFAFSGVKIIVTAFHAMQDTKTPLKAAWICLFINLLLNFILIFPLKVGGIALASSISQIINFAILFNIMNKRTNGLKFNDKTIFLKIIICALASGMISFYSYSKLPQYIPRDFVCIIFAGFIGLLAHFILCWLLKVKQAIKTFEWLNKKLFKKKS